MFRVIHPTNPKLDAEVPTFKLALDRANKRNKLVFIKSPNDVIVCFKGANGLWVTYH